MPINTKDYQIVISQNLKSNEKHTKFFYFFRIDKKLHRGLINYEGKDWSKRDRISFAIKEFNKIKAEKENSIDSDATLNEIVDMYLENLKEGEYKKNRTSYYDRQVKKKLGSKKAKDILPMHIQKVVNDNIKNGDSPRTAKQAIEIISPAFNIARANRIVTHNPCDDVNVKLPKSKKIVVNATQRLTIVYKTIMTTYKDDPFYRAFFILALQGRRKGEILNLRWENISFEYDYYFLPDTKSGEEQKIFLPPNAKTALLEFQKAKGWVFESPRIKGKRILDAKRQTAKLKEKLGDWFTMHYLRNIIVSAMAENGIDAIHLSGALGHKDATTINKYLTMNYLQGSKMASDLIHS